MHPLLLLLPIILALPCFNPPLTSLSPRGRPHMTFGAGIKVPFWHANFEASPNSSVPAVTPIALTGCPTALAPIPALAPDSVMLACDHETTTPPADSPSRVANANVCPIAVNPLSRLCFSLAFPALPQAHQVFVTAAVPSQFVPVINSTTSSAPAIEVAVADVPLGRPRLSPVVPAQVFNIAGPAVPSQFAPVLNATSPVDNTSAPAPTLEDRRTFAMLARSLPGRQAPIHFDSAAAFSPGGIAALAAAVFGLFAIALHSARKNQLSSHTARTVNEAVIQVDKDDSPPTSVVSGSDKYEVDKVCSPRSPVPAVEEDPEEASEADSPPASAASETKMIFAFPTPASPLENKGIPAADSNSTIEPSETTDGCSLDPSALDLTPSPPTSPSLPPPAIPINATRDTPSPLKSTREHFTSLQVLPSPSNTGLPESPTLPTSTDHSQSVDVAPSTDIPPAIEPEHADAPSTTAATTSDSDVSPVPRPATSVRLTVGVQHENTKEEKEWSKEGLEVSWLAGKAGEDEEKEEKAMKKGKKQKGRERREKIRRRKRRGREAIAGPSTPVKEEDEEEDEEEEEEKEEEQDEIAPEIEPLSSGSREQEKEEPGLSLSRWAPKDEDEDGGNGWTIVARKKQGPSPPSARTPVKEERKEDSRKTRSEECKEKWKKEKAKEEEEQEKARKEQEIRRGVGPSSWADEVEAEEKGGHELAVSTSAAAPDVKKEQGLQASRWASGRESEEKKNKQQGEELSWRSRSGERRPRAPQQRGGEKKAKGTATCTSPFPAAFSSMFRAGPKNDVPVGGGRSGRVSKKAYCP